MGAAGSDLQNRIVIITGASSGIGEATARRLAREGAVVVLAARRRERLERLAEEIAASGGHALAIPTDITVEADRRRLVERTMETYGRVDALVNNAGYGQRGPIECVPIEAIRQNFETNLFALIALTQLVIPILRTQGRGRIVNVSSVAGRIARPFSAVYDATKHALEAISDGLRGELAPFGIHVIVIEPGFIQTEFLHVANEVSRSALERSHPYAPFLADLDRRYERWRRWAGRPEDVAAVIMRALTEARPRPRYAVPKHARLLLALKRWIPDHLFDALMRRQMGLVHRPLES
ncbi:MAG: SDR family NAD(P)-dependent oxidoreductase [Blastocatellia bacterium]|nr:SDR family NAD(P)-dependent oxidoreductase [Blastocatellia bacterium]MCS7158444.1 SDR family NAD(P)-dependent oxidoreductase [Blastocatellia bacterium]MCX7753484.1 SDR family NAD(P)-dependent oxidoreductase [Blastocatellia bacterium]MDW8167875.1 SDR family NAD(P)-dependent oxidoreductase [Acidobacteriota bacterium]MDW8255909.1 SDR family NAD(P)-dependent oxidoreductase [Acidobacteriota bacterium]